jgi:hypothetical protein
VLDNCGVGVRFLAEARDISIYVGLFNHGTQTIARNSREQLISRSGKFLLALSNTVILGSESRGTRDQVFRRLRVVRVTRNNRLIFFHCLLSIWDDTDHIQNTPVVFIAYIRCCRNVFTEPLTSSGHLFWLNYSCFQVLREDTRTQRRQGDVTSLLPQKSHNVVDKSNPNPSCGLAFLNLLNMLRNIATNHC